MAASREQTNRDLIAMLQSMGARNDSYDILANHQEYLNSLPRTEEDLNRLVIKTFNDIAARKKHLSESQQLALAQEVANYDKLNAIKAGVWQGQ